MIQMTDYKNTSGSLIAIIPARGGSKRIPRKNIKDFLGKPIISYSIEAAIRSQLFDEVIVSTEDLEIAEISKFYGATLPFFRSNETSTDNSTTSEVIKEVLRNYEIKGRIFKNICCIYPCAPFIKPDRLIDSFNLFVNSNADSMISVVKYGHPIQRSLKIENNRLRLLYPENQKIRTQEFEASYHDTGQFYWINYSSFIKNDEIFTDNTIPYLLKESEVQDIDTIEDWKNAEIKYKITKQNNEKI